MLHSTKNVVRPLGTKSSEYFQFEATIMLLCDLTVAYGKPHIQTQ